MPKFRNFIAGLTAQSTLTGTEQIPLRDVDGSGDTESVTITALDARYVDASDDRYGPDWVPATIIGSSGSPTAATTASRFGGVSFPNTGTPTIRPAIIAPTWAFDIDMYWTVPSGSGDVNWTCTNDAAEDGGNLAVSGGATNTIVTAPAANILEVTRLRAAVSLPTGSVVSLRVSRNAGEGTDTHSAAAEVIGFRVLPIAT